MCMIENIQKYLRFNMDNNIHYPLTKQNPYIIIHLDTDGLEFPNCTKIFAQESKPQLVSQFQLLTKCLLLKMTQRIIFLIT